jgi:hypothetical protein
MRNLVGIASKNEASGGVIVISAEGIAEQHKSETVQMLLVLVGNWVSTPDSRPVSRHLFFSFAKIAELTWLLSPWVRLGGGDSGYGCLCLFEG